jgi:effector-binding domain-containing protein
MRRVGEVDVVRPFAEEANFRQFEQSTKVLENHINMNNLDEKTKEVIRYYQKLNKREDDDYPHDEDIHSSPFKPYN